MAPPILASSWFGAAGSCYARMAQVLTFTAAQHCPEWDRHIFVSSAAPASARQSPSFEANAHKMTMWLAIISAAADGDRLLLVDADTMITRPLDALWSRPFDVAWTVRTSEKCPINTGVVAVRVSDRTRAFFAVWHAECQKMLRDALHHQRWRRTYGGIHQAALGCLIETGQTSHLDLARLSVLEWNCEDTSWASFDPVVTRIVHIKSNLRRALFGTGAVPESAGLRPLITLWRRLEREAKEAAPA